MVQKLNSSELRRFDRAFARVWLSLRSGDDPDLSEHERQLLHHVPVEGGVALGWLASHLALPKSSASVLVKSLERRGFVKRTRDRTDERRLAIVLTKRGRERVEADSALDPGRLGSAMSTLSRRDRAALLRTIELLADAGEAPPGE